MKPILIWIVSWEPYPGTVFSELRYTRAEARVQKASLTKGLPSSKPKIHRVELQR